MMPGHIIGRLVNKDSDADDHAGSRLGYRYEESAR
jgi:hypothetical protein